MSYKWIFGFIGMYFSGGKGFLFGFLLGWLIDTMFGHTTVRFTFWRTAPDDSSESRQYQQHTEQQAWHPYVDVTLQEAYRTLGIPSNATDEQVRQAYRQLALRYHPDRVASQGEAARQDAEENFQRITEARDIIMRARGVQ